MRECAELASPAAVGAVALCLRDAFSALAPAIRASAAGMGGVERGPGEGMRVAICGVGLMVAGGLGGGAEKEGGEEKGHGAGFTAFIVEVNNCPAMPKPGKRWSTLYEKHIVTFLRRLVELGLRGGVDGENELGDGKVAEVGGEGECDRDDECWEEIV